MESGDHGIRGSGDRPGNDTLTKRSKNKKTSNDQKISEHQSKNNRAEEPQVRKLRVEVR